MIVPTRADLVHCYWLDGLTISATATRCGMSKHCIAKLFKRYGILKRATGGHGHRVGRSARVNQVRLELMLLPSVEEWREMRPWWVLRDELEWLAREARCHT